MVAVQSLFLVGFPLFRASVERASFLLQLEKGGWNIATYPSVVQYSKTVESGGEFTELTFKMLCTDSDMYFISGTLEHIGLSEKSETDFDHLCKPLGFVLVKKS